MAQPDEVAAELGQTTTSGAFRTKVASARVFGAIEVRRGQVSLTPIGHRLVDPEQVAQARVDAFLHVPLFSRVFEEYRGRNLPPSKGLEAQMERLGVSPKQTEKARQALQRSADRAGFFQSGRDRLVRPALSGGPGENEADVDSNANRSSPQPSGSLPAWAEQMWLTLLSDDAASWTPEQTKAYVDGARTAYKAQG